MKKTVVFILSICFVFHLSAQSEKPVDYPKLLKQLERGLSKGSKRSLRDLGTLLDKPTIRPNVHNLLQKYTLFTSEEIALGQVHRDDFLHFFYENLSTIQFSSYFGAFFITPIEERLLTFQLPETIPPIQEDLAIQTKNAISDFSAAFKERQPDALINTIHALQKINSKEAIQFLQQQLGNPNISKIFKKDSSTIYLELIKAVEDVPHFSTFQTILALVKNKQLLFFQVEDSLAKQTNILAPKHLSGSETIEYFEHLTDSLHTLHSMRTFGYEQLFPFQKNFFFEDVDYYGKILCQSDHLPWITHNAITDLLQTQHPRILLYLASFIYKNRNNDTPFKQFDALQCMSDLTNMSFNISKDKEMYSQFLFYWWQKYEHYEWSPKANCFINKEEKIERLAFYEKQFRRLNSKNDSVALASYQILTEGNPEEIIELARQFRPLMRNINTSLPPLKAYFLEQLVQLTAFCRANEVSYTLTPQLESAMTILNTLTSEKKIYQFENQFVGKISSLADLTAIEYWAILNVKNRPLNLSLGRILDKSYSKYWDKIIADPAELRLYLKKAQLFNTIGASGICNDYLKKFAYQTPFQQEQLNYLLSIETDIDIKNQITQVIVKDTPAQSTAQISIADFLKHPLDYNKIELQVLPPPSTQELKALAQAIRKAENPAKVLQYFQFLSYHPQLDAVPTLMQLINEKRIIIHNEERTLTIGERVVPILEDIYDYSFASTDKDFFATQEWKALWKTNRKEYKNWGRLFLEQKLADIRQQEHLDIEILNNFAEAAGKDAYFIEAILDLLPRVRPLKDIRSLSLDTLLSPEKHLPYFETIDLEYKYLDDIPKLFDLRQANTMVLFMEKKATHFEALDQGAFLNNLFQRKWFLEFVLSGQISVQQVQQFSQILQFYLDESDYLSSYEEQRTLQNLTHLANIGKPLTQKMEAAIALDTDEKLKANIQQGILARISYQDIPLVLEYLPYLSTSAQRTAPHSFLYKDFGLPIFELDSLAIQELQVNHQKLTEFELYQYYLEQFGVDFLDRKGHLDFNKIYEILQFDIVSPMVGSGGRQRDYFVYGIIKLLELYFETRLGFHEKLNESQTFYTFTSNKRAKAWRNYLEKNILIDQQTLLAPSFNQVQVEE